MWQSRDDTKTLYFTKGANSVLIKMGIFFYMSKVDTHVYYIVGNSHRCQKFCKLILKCYHRNKFHSFKFCACTNCNNVLFSLTPSSWVSRISSFPFGPIWSGVANFSLQTRFTGQTTPSIFTTVTLRCIQDGSLLQPFVSAIYFHSYM